MSTEQERQEWARLAEYVIPTTFQAHFGHAIIALLADVDRLTGDNAALSEALDTALLHLKESEADVDRLTQERDMANVSLSAALRDAANMRKERDALAAELAQVRAQPWMRVANGSKSVPTQEELEETDKAVARIKRIELLYTRYGNDRDKWPYYAQESFAQLDAAQTAYEAKYC
jgi:hypothetical protein